MHGRGVARRNLPAPDAITWPLPPLMREGPFVSSLSPLHRSHVSTKPPIRIDQRSIECWKAARSCAGSETRGTQSELGSAADDRLAARFSKCDFASGRPRMTVAAPLQSNDYGVSSRTQMLRKLIGGLGSPWACSLIGAAPCFLYDGAPMYSVSPLSST